MKLELVDAATTGTWKVDGSQLSGECDGVTFTGERSWWGRTWTIVGTSEFPIPERILLFISAHGMEHGFWRDMRSGHHSFDIDHFVFCNTPALLPHIVGRATVAAINETPERDAAVKLYVRNRTMRTTSMVREHDRRGIARHVAIHRALATDHRAFLATWQDNLAGAAGRGGATWPPKGTINSRVGTLLVGLTWEMPPESRDGAEWDQGYRSLRTEVTSHGDRTKPAWTLALAEGRAPTHVIGSRGLVLQGKPSVPIDRIANLLEEAAVVQLEYGPKLRVSVHQLATARNLTAARQLVELLLQAKAGSTSPYR